MQTGDDHVARPHPHRQDTFDLRDQLMADEHHNHHLGDTYPSDEEHSVLEDDSDAEERDDYMEDDDGSSSLSIPNESIDFDLVYALHSFAATVEGQANVVKGDSLFLMDDSNSYWWLVRVLKTQEVGYIPAENIETPFERLARLNKHRNVDLASATHTERQESVDHIRDNLSSRAGSNQATPSPTPGTVRSGSRNRVRQPRGVAFTPSLSVHRYPPAVWGDEDEDDDDVSWDDEGYEDEDPDLAEEQEQERERAMAAGGAPRGMEPDDGMSWEDGAVEDVQAKKQVAIQEIQVAPPPAEPESTQKVALTIPSVLQPGPQQQPQPQREVAAQPPPEQSQQPSPAAQPPRDRVTIVEEPTATAAPTVKNMDPTQAKDTRKISITPPVARDTRPEQQQQQPQPGGPLLPSAIMQQQEDDRKRTREEIEALGDAARKKVNQGKAGTPTPTQAKPQGGAKLRKPEPVATEEDSGKDRKKKSGGVFGGLFGRRKDKGKDKPSPSGSDNSLGAGGSTEIIVGRGSEESGRSSSQQHSGFVTAPSTEQISSSAPRQQPQVQPPQVQVAPLEPQVQQRQPQQSRPQETQPQSVLQSQLSQHASQLRQRDQQQQALYQQYLNRSPSSPPEAQPSYGLQSASAIMPASVSLSSSSSGNGGLTTPSKPRPGSLVLSPTAMDGQGVGLPDLSVVRVFAGDNLQTEATFKTVLLNSSTTASDLVRQAIQRFRLPSGENETDYYLTIKQFEGSSAELLPHEKPLGVFETLVEAAMELPKVKRSSVGSISSVASNLSMHPAIKKLSMNDFTDDSAVKFYLNRKSAAKNANVMSNDGDETLLESPRQEDLELPRSPGLTAGIGVTPERFSSPSYKFALQLHIHPEDLPDDMVFDPLTEAIVFKNTLRDRSHASVTSSSSGVSQTKRKKIFVFPKNVTVAEVIELGLERFGIVDGVVDGGDEVEDKLTKRRSSSRVRYGLTVDVGTGKEKELHPSSKVIDAYLRPPTYRATERRFNDAKRRSVDSAQLLLGSAEDIGPEDPVFTLRRAVTYRTSRHRSSAPLDEIALQNLHRESMSNSSVASESTTGPSEEPRQRQMSKQEIIAAQRAATRANQRAILSAHTNSARGLDVRLPTNAIIRSSRYEMDDRMRYSYVEPDGETTYDISDIVEEEWRERSDTSGDLLHGVLSRGKDGLGARLDRVLNKIRNEKGAPVKAQTESGPEPASSRSATPNANARSLASVTPTGHHPKGSIGTAGHRTTTPTQTRPPHGRQGSTASTASGYPSPTGSSNKSHQERQRLYIPKDYFEHKELMAVIRSRAGLMRRPELPPLDPVDDLLFGREIDIRNIHPQVREVYSGVYKQLDEMDNALDELLKHVAHAF